MVAHRTQISQLGTKSCCVFIEHGEFCHSSFITRLSDEYNNADATLINLHDPNDHNSCNNISSSRTYSDPFRQKFNTINKNLCKVKSGRLAVEIDHIFVILPTKHGLHYQVRVVHVIKLHCMLQSNSYRKCKYWFIGTWFRKCETKTRYDINEYD